MYAVINENNKIIGIHDELKVVMNFAKQEKLPVHISVVKLKKRMKKELKKKNMYLDKYLVRFGDTYMPYSLYDTCKKESDEVIYDLEYAKFVLLRIFEDDEINDDEIIHVRRTIALLNKMIDNEMDGKNTLSLDTLEELKRMDSEYQRLVDTE